MRTIPCPKCSEPLDGSAAVSLCGVVHAEHDPEGKARADLILECDSCGQRWNVFVPLADFFDNPIVEGA